MDFPGRLLAGFLAVILVLLFPLPYIAQSDNENIDYHVNEYTQNLSDTIREKGYIDKAMYERFVDFLDTTGELYDIDMEDIHPVTGDEMNELSQLNYHSCMIAAKAKPQMNVFHNKRLGLQVLSASALHTHTAACYTAGVTKHTHTGNTNDGGGCYTIESTGNAECGGTEFVDATQDTPGGTVSIYTCPKCGTHYYDNKPEHCKYIVVKTVYSLGCGKTEDGYYDMNGNTAIPLCSQVVISLTATNTSQTITQGNSIISTATASMLDGSMKTVDCIVSGYDSSIVGNQTVTLTYYGLVDTAYTSGTKSCTINVTVVSNKSFQSLSVTPDIQIIPRLGVPSFTVTARYSDASTRVLNSLEYSMSSFDSTRSGPQTVTFTHTENGITGTAAATVCIDELTGISVMPKELTVERYTSATSLPITVTASYLYTSNKIVTGYTLSGYSPGVLGLQNVTVSYTENGRTVSASFQVNVTVLHRTCPRCENTYDLSPEDIDLGCPYCKKLVTGISVSPNYVITTQGDSLPISVQATYADGSSDNVTGWVSDYDSLKTGLQLITIEYGGYAAQITVWVNEKMLTCPVCGCVYPASQNRCPVCASTVVSITVNPDNVTVGQYEDINLSVTANYADGSSEVVTDWRIDCTTSRAGKYTATVTYENVSTQIIVNVMSMTSITCPICGKVYEPGDNPRGCPICSNKMIGIEAYLESGSNLVQKGSTPNISVVLIYLDTHRELSKEGYTIIDYDANKLGKQNIKVRYAEFEALLEVEVVNTLNSITCPKGHVYYLNEDGSDPGCPYCAMTENINTVYYFDITYLGEILELIYTDGVYPITSGNFITIIVTKRDISILTKVQKAFLQTSLIGRKRRFIYGGEVL